MGYLSQILERRATPGITPEWIEAVLGGPPSGAGIQVTPQSAMQSVAVYACVRVIAETVATIPLVVYRRLPNGGKERARETGLYRLLHDAPNPRHTSFEFREMLQAHLCLRGNAYIWPEVAPGGEVVALWPLRPDRMDILQAVDDRTIWYRYTPIEGAPLVFRYDEIVHLRGLSSDGVVGLSPIALAREAVGTTLASEAYAGRFFGNGAQPSGVLQVPKQLSKEAYDRLKASWQAQYQGSANAHKTAILEEGTHWQQIAINAKDAQLLETRGFNKREIATLFRVPPHKIGILDDAKYANIEQQAIEFVTDTLQPWLERWEQVLELRLLTPAERETLCIEHLVDGLLRGDAEARAKSYAIGRQNGWLSANEIRATENLNPIEGGDLYLVPANMQPADQVAAGTAPAPAGGTPNPAGSGADTVNGGGARTVTLLALVDAWQRIEHRRDQAGDKGQGDYAERAIRPHLDAYLIATGRTGQDGTGAALAIVDAYLRAIRAGGTIPTPTVWAERSLCALEASLALQAAAA